MSSASGTVERATPGRTRRAVGWAELGSAAKHLVLIAASVLALIPVLFMLLAAFKTSDEALASPFGWPRHPTWAAFKTALDAGFLRWLLNTTIITVAAIVATLALSSLAAYAFSRMRFRGSGAVFTLMISLMVVPPIVMLLPLFQMMSSLSLINTYQAVIAIYVGLMMPFSVYLLTSFFKTIPGELLESAGIDGASSLRAFVSIVLPLSTPALITLSVVNLLWAWNELLIALVLLQDDSMKTLMVGITVFQSHYSLNVPVTMAGLLIATLPIVVVYLAGQRYFVHGLAAGAVKE